MEISLEKIELVKDRTGASYKEAKEALEKTEGNVVDAIIYIEECAMEREESKISADKKEIFEKIKALIKKGNITKIQFKKDDNVILNIPITAGAIGTVIFPWAAITAAVAALATKCNIEIIKDNGEVVDINDLSGGRIENIRDKAEDVIVNLGEKASDAFDDIKIKAGDAYENVKYKASERKEKKYSANDGDFEFSDKEDCDYCSDCEFDCSEADDSDIGVDTDIENGTKQEGTCADTEKEPDTKQE